ncbi:MAG: hypothetical protein A3A29_00410 [Candidatus Ryanbacteria bacterium RIFCSPLOWO2_01_FULL_47_79]|uniref:Alpha/beta hydrolase n=1 Tax=Candidatus Yanofskybacteria bacterium RIFCSPHIGHO2_12_FULL_45_19b TaxID=1802689 RepID=A0A1F8G297_9BACT|nr:MAG: hypothetical protein A3F25_02130 [Candidatus Yanofskybacteria bacterium RIFCSPHIGHO2_12_FULL_45_19b]OGZ53298.1 MAG: hypothetical protein A3A29_00410 [Candidatus Ryanbacteria bacterium RIFCSPLOWO2_01_FULL_47_79]
MKNIYIIHGWDGSPEEPMLQWLKSNLEKAGHQVTVPAMPDPGTPTIASWVGKLQETIKPNTETILVGHSVGCQAVLRYLETLSDEVKIAGVVLIAPWMELDQQTITEEGEAVIAIAKPWMETPINFTKMKSHIGKTVAIFSDNDPYVPLNQKDLFARELNAEVVVENNKGHFSVGDGITELPAALEAVEKL